MDQQIEGKEQTVDIPTVENFKIVIVSQRSHKRGDILSIYTELLFNSIYIELFHLDRILKKQNNVKDRKQIHVCLERGAEKV